MHECEQDVVQHVMNALGDYPGRHGDLGDPLGDVGVVTFDRCGAQRGPDEPFGDVWVTGVEGVKVCMRFPFLEQQLDTPLLKPL